MNPAKKPKLCSKQVYCLIPPCRKLVTYTVESGVSDITLLQKALWKMCKTDLALNVLIKDKFLIFQQIDESGEYCDLTTESVLSNKCEVKVQLLDMPTSTEITLDTLFRSQLAVNKL